MSPKSPHELASAAACDAVMVAGRVVRVDGARLWLADALAVIEVALSSDAQATALREGDLVSLEGRWSTRSLEATRLYDTHRPARFGEGGGDVARLLFGGVGRRLAQRAKGLAAIRALMTQEGFLEVDTPSLVPSPGLDLHLDAVGCEGDGYLITSPEYQMKRLVAGGLPRVFQLARCFRKDERGRLHNPEFLMLEWYRAFEGYEAVMADTEAIVRAVAIALRGAAELIAEDRRIDVGVPFDRVTVAEAFARYASTSAEQVLAMAEHDEDAYFGLMIEKVEPALATFERPVFLCDYPASQASLARKKPEDPRFCERFELYAAGVELCNGFGELTDPVEQRARLLHDRQERARRALPVYPLDERFVGALEEGLPPCAGNALGVDRLIALATGASSIGEVQSFPADVLLRSTRTSAMRRKRSEMSRDGALGRLDKQVE